MFRNNNDAGPDDAEPSIDWTGNIARQAVLLRSTMQTSETGFISVGSQLQTIHVSTQEISQRLAGLLDNYLNKDGTESLNELRSISERSTRQLNLFNNFSVYAFTQLQNLETPLTLLVEYFKDFDCLVRRLRMMGITARIEAARIGEDGSSFVHLAEEVSVLGQQIAAKAKEVCSYVNRVYEVIALHENKLGEVIGRHKDISTRVSNDMSSNLQILNEKREMSKQTASEISSVSKDVLHNIHVVVQSVQYHDITRQQIDHVIGALQSIKKQDSVLEVVPVCEIQVAHLKRAAKDFENAILAIITALGDLSNGVTTMLSESRKMANFTDGSGNTFFDYVVRGLETVSDTVMKDREVILELTSSLEQVNDNIRMMKSFMHEMAFVGSEIELLALNSRVKAAKTGTNGSALGVIAEAIQRLSVDASNRINEVVDQMSQMVSLARDLTDADTIDVITKSTEREIQKIVNKLKDVIGFFHVTNKSTIEVFRETGKVCATIAERVKSLAEEISRHKEVATSLCEVSCELDQFAARLRGSASDSDRTLIDKRLEEMLKRYTMEAERLTHNTIVNGDQSQSGLPSEADGGIELF